jgi:beta-galactosidase
MVEYKKLIQPLAVKAVDLRQGKVEIYNKYDFSSLEGLLGSWEVVVDGMIQQRGFLPALKTPPGKTTTVALPIVEPVLFPGAEAFLNLRFVFKEDAVWAEAGHEVAWEQFILPFSLPVQEAKDGKGKKLQWVVNDNPVDLIIKGDRFSLRFDKTSGELTHFISDGTELIESGPRLNIWRAATDNDGFKFAADIDWMEYKLLNQWIKFGLNRLDYLLEAMDWRREESGAFLIETTHRVKAEGMESGFLHRTAYRVFPSGDLKTDHLIECDSCLPLLSRVGIMVVMPAGFETFTWLGRGPEESYIDRKAGVPVGLYRGSVDEQYVPYIMPQENGNKTDVRWACVQNDKGVGLLAAGSILLETGVSHFTANDLYHAYHTNELTRRENTYWTLDLQQCGLGGNSCGPMTLPQYLIEPGRFQFSIVFRPIHGESDLRFSGRKPIG